MILSRHKIDLLGVVSGDRYACTHVYIFHTFSFGVCTNDYMHAYVCRQEG